MLTFPLRPCNSTQNETVESLAAKFLSPGPGLGRDVEVCDSEEEQEEEGLLETAYAPCAPLKLKGNTLDLIPFLSNDGKTASLLRSTTQSVSFDVLLGKHVLVCCVFLPMPDCASDYWLSIKASCHELSTRNCDFEMVLVPLTETDSAADESLFLDFFDQTPGLAIPFSDFETRHNICTFLGLQSSNFFGLRGIVVDPSGIILHHMLTSELFLYYGSDFFPFDVSHIKSIDAEDDVLRSRLDPFYCRKLSINPDAFVNKPLSLQEDILQCDPSRVLSRFSPDAGPSLTVAELSNKYVGLYICHSMDFLFYLYRICEGCIINGQELEIIVVCLPCYLDMTTFNQRRQLCSSDSVLADPWFSFPDDDKISRRLWRIFGRSAQEDCFIIVPPNCVDGELQGRQLIEQGEEYPFTRSTVLEQRFTDLRSFTPSPTSWFEGADKKHTCLVRNGKNSNVRQSCVRGKKLLLYLDTPDLSWDDAKLFHRLMKSYPEIKAKGWEVVFIPLDDYNYNDPRIGKMPWPIMPAYHAGQVSVYQQLFFPKEAVYCGNYLIAVDKDGKIVSRQAKTRLKKHGVKDCLFDDNLYEEIGDRLRLVD